MMISNHFSFNDIKVIYSIKGKQMKRSLIIFIILLGLAFSMIGITPVYAATLTVTNTNNSGAGSLRQAIASAAIGNIITFASTLSGKTIRLASPLTLSKNVTIDGSSLASRITISGDTDGNGSPDVGIFFINPTVQATLDSLIITKGYTNYGGGIYNKLAILTIINTIISNNSVSLNGGGIYNNAGTVTITRSAISGNSSIYGGGGIFSYQGTLNIANSTISGNYTNGPYINVGTSSGGGIYNQESGLTIKNSTLASNSANNNGGAIFNYDNSTAYIYNTTIAFNQADGDADNNGQGAGIYNGSLYAEVFNLRNSLVSGNYVAGSQVYDDCSGTVNSYGRNLIGAASVTSSGNCTVNTASGTWALLNDLNLLGILQNNGGPTATVALLPGSNAIDGGDLTSGCIDESSFLLLTDQRGLARISGALCDIGAFEYSAPQQRAKNGGFNTYPTSASKIPSNWSAANFAATDGKFTTAKKEGAASVILFGAAGKTKTLTQTLAFSGSTGSLFTFSFWAKGASIPATGMCSGQILLYNGATLKQTKTLNCSTGTYSFQNKKLAFNSNVTFSKAIIKFTYSKSSGSVWFDAASLSTIIVPGYLDFPRIK